MVGFCLLLFDPVENAQTSFFATFSWIFHYQLHWETMPTSVCARHSALTLLLAVIKMEKLSVNITITVSSESLFRRSLLYNQDINTANTELLSTAAEDIKNLNLCSLIDGMMQMMMTEIPTPSMCNSSFSLQSVL